MSTEKEQLIPIQQLSDRVVAGMPLPFNVRDESGHLLLARGLPITDEAMRRALLARGYHIDVRELPGGRVQRDAPAPDSPFAIWDRLLDNLAGVLLRPTERHFLQRVREAALHVLALRERNADLMLFLILRHDHGRFEHYGTSHALHVACLCSLLAQRLGLGEFEQQRAVGAALTMNLSMLELQGRLAQQATALTESQRRAVREHPTQSAMMLRAAGLDDDAWLAAVEDHHERRGGGGYPSGLQSPGELSQMLRLVDQFTAKHSPRAYRAPVPARQAAREVFLENPGDPLAATLIKEFGIYPPGTFVRLASGELAIVVRRGQSAQSPRVVVVTSRQGVALTAPLPRDTALPEFAIVDCVAERQVRLRVPAAALYAETA